MKQFLSLFIFILFNTSFVCSQDLEKQQAVYKSNFYNKLLNGEQQITVNQQSYDVTYYSLDLIPDPATKLLMGKVEVILSITAQELNYIELDFWDGMVIDSLFLSDSPETQLDYTQINDLLTIDLGQNYSEDQQLKISIVYQGYPEDSGYGSFYFANIGKDFIGTYSQPYGARAWWPCKDYPVDKPDSIDIRVTVPNNLIVASNGVLKSKTDDGNFSTYWWHHGYPIATYLVSLAIYPYFVWSDTYVSESGQEMPIMFYTFADTNNATPSYLVPNYKKTRSMIEFFAGIFGEYPFLDEKYGHAQWNLSFGMEHQTLTSMGDPTERRVAHELSHMWWGDMITCRTYNHIWLNEGFARYAESLWFAHSGAAASASAYQVGYHTYKGPGTIYVEDVYNDDIFDIELSYNKPSWVLHMMRHIVGDSSFFEILKTYHYSENHQHKTATTEDFQAICEQIAHMDFNKFYQQWIYGEYFPRYSSAWQYKPVENGYNVKVEIKQIQNNTGLFWMPVDVYTDTKNESFVQVAMDSLEKQSFEFFVSERPFNIELDRNNWILRETTKHMLTPYTDKIQLNNPFQTPGTGVLKISGQAYNPDSVNIGMSVFIENIDASFQDSIGLYDDGSHGDAVAGDKNFSATWPVPPEETYYNLHWLTHNLDSEFITYQESLSRFTTIGPVVLENYITSTNDTITRPGENFLVKLRLKNNSQSHTIENVTADLASKDSCIMEIVQDNPNYGALSPGEVETTVGTYLLKINPDWQQ